MRCFAPLQNQTFTNAFTILYPKLIIFSLKFSCIFAKFRQHFGQMLEYLGKISPNLDKLLTFYIFSRIFPYLIEYNYTYSQQLIAFHVSILSHISIYVFVFKNPYFATFRRYDSGTDPRNGKPCRLLMDARDYAEQDCLFEKRNKRRPPAAS